MSMAEPSGALRDLADGGDGIPVPRGGGDFQVLLDDGHSPSTAYSPRFGGADRISPAHCACPAVSGGTGSVA